MHDTFGQFGSTLLPPFHPLEFLASKLAQQLPTDGSMKSLMQWKEEATPSGRQYFRLVVLERPLKESGYTLLPRPLASDYRDRGHWGNPCIQRRVTLGKQIGLSMLFKGTPCPMCVLSMMGYGAIWLKSLCSVQAMPSFLKWRRHSSKQQCESDRTKGSASDEK